jgi:tripartite-type tricarboxylate transporter receptor subunit TctC
MSGLNTVRWVIKHFFLLVLGALYFSTPSWGADTWPVKPIHFVVGFTAGGPSDLIARDLGLKMAQLLGQPVVIENRPGAGGNIAAEYVARSAADGYTWLLGNNSILSTNAALYKKIGFDPVQDFAPVGMVGTQPNILIVNNALPVNSVKELIAHIRSHPDSMNYASSGAGAAAHLAGELFKSSANVSVTHIPYKGAIPALTDVMSGHAQMMFATSASVMPFIRDGRVRALAVTSKSRMKELPDLPTMMESGLAGFEAVSWHGIVVRAGTPVEIIQRINAQLATALARDDLLERFKNLGVEPTPGSAQSFSEYISSETPKWTKVVRDSGARVE